jgi:hypothetical protein
MSRLASILSSRALLVTSTVFSALIVFYLNNERIELSEDLVAERAQMQNTLEAKDILNKKLIGAIADAEELRVHNKQLAQANETKDLSIKSLSNEAVQTSRWKIESSKLQKQIPALKEELSRLKEEKSGIESRMGSERAVWQKRISELELQVAQLETRLAGNTIIAANNFRIEAIRGRNNRLTSKAQRAQRILVSFHANEELMKASQSGNLYLSVSGPGTQKLTSANAETVAIQLGDKRVEIPVVAKAKLQKMKEGWQEIVMTIVTRLKPGIYQADVYSDTHHLGGAQIRLD